MAKKKDKKSKKAAKPAKRAGKPAAKKAVKKTTAKKVNKPVAKKAAKPTKAKKVKKPVKAKIKSKPKPLAKPTSSVGKKTSVKSQKTKKVEAKKEVKKVLSKKEEAKLKKNVLNANGAANKNKKTAHLSKEESKKAKPADAELEGEELESGLLEIEPAEGAVEEDEELIEEVVAVVVEEKPKKAKGRGRGRGRRDHKKHYDSEDFVRKQIVKIDLTKPLIKKPKKIEPEPYLNNKDKRSRYSDKELTEFKEILLSKLQEAKVDYDLLKQTLTNTDNHGTDDTSPTFKLLEDGSDMLSKEEVAQLASRQEKYIVNLQNALIRIQNKSYGICRVTGKLIPKERLRSVPHATLGIDAKLSQYN